MEAVTWGSGVKVTGVWHFDLEKTLFCGQAFRWTAERTRFFGVARGRALEVWQEGDAVFFNPCTLKEFDEIWQEYFDLKRDYGRLQSEARAFVGDEILPDIHILRQPLFETLITFILSANNHIQRIRGLVERLAERAGKPIPNRAGVYDFPEPEELASLSETELRSLGCGYRAPFLVETAQRVMEGCLEDVGKMPYDEAKRRLMALPGVGDKVADCTLLYGAGRMEAFPVDVWVHRALKERWGVEGSRSKLALEARKRFGAHGGYLQQVLFYESRQAGRKGA